MGVKGDQMKQESAMMADLLLEKLAPIGGVTSKKMFGGHGIFHDSKMFGLIDSKGQCFIKADASTIRYFESTGASKHSKMPYYNIPVSLLDDLDTLHKVVKEAIAISK